MWNFQENIYRTNSNTGGGGTPNDIVIEDHQIGVENCTNCKTITVYVPPAENRDVVISKLGAASYASTTLNACLTGTNLSVDGTTNITATTTFRFGIDSFWTTGNNEDGYTEITVIVYDGATPLAATTLERIHQDPQVVC